MMDRLPPQAIEFEEAILGGMMINADHLDVALDMLKPNDFYRTAHKTIFEVMQKLERDEKPVDVNTVVEELKTSGFLESVGGASYLAKLLDDSPTDTEHYAKVIREKRMLREMIVTCNKAIQDCYEANGDAAQIVYDAQNSINAINPETSASKIVKISDVLMEVTDKVDQLFRRPGITGIPTGYEKLDYYTTGFQNSDLDIIAGRPAMGKTAFALNCMINMGKMGRPCLMFSLEMANLQLGNRAVSLESGLNCLKFRSGRFRNDDFSRISNASEKLYNLPIYLYDMPNLHYQEIVRIAQKAHKEYGIEIVFIDYLQLVKGDNSKKKHEEIGDITRAFKGLAKRLDIPVVALSQLNRELEKRPHPYKRPNLSDLKASGDIEQDADLVMFLYRPEVYNEKDEYNSPLKPDICEVIIGKHRNGPTGMVDLHMNKKSTRFTSVDDLHDPRG